MNCKQGDVAVIVRSYAGNEGKIVRCLRLLKNDMAWVGIDGITEKFPTWEIDRQLKGWKGDTSCYVADYKLRPIRDPGDDATDEMIVLLGKPVREGETV